MELELEPEPMELLELQRHIKNSWSLIKMMVPMKH
jgi:hypothetical protein